ncbi:MAG: SDR family oxidoreductase [Verrucomicrobiota bacterium]
MADKGRKVVVITGTSSGIGECMAHQLADLGYTVYGGSLTPDQDKTHEGLESLFLDVASDDAVQAFVDQILAKEDKVDVLVNNAGYAYAGPIEDTPFEEAEAIMNVNFYGAVRLCKALLPTLRTTGGAKILNVTSGAGFTAEPYAGFYSASKFALEGYTEALRHELWPLDVQVVLIQPGWIRTKIAINAKRVATVQPVYKERWERMANLVEDFVLQGMDQDDCARKIVSVVQRRKPRWRYPIGKDVRSSFWSRKFFPSRVFEHFVRVYYKLHF